MSEVSSVVAGYGIAVVAVAFYGAWIMARGRAIGRELGIGDGNDPADDGGGRWT